MGAKVKKKQVNVNELLVKMTFVLKGYRQVINVHTTAREACDFVDSFNCNKAIYNKKEKEKFENKFYIFSDYIKKENVCIDFNTVKCFTVPFFVEDEENYNFKILEVQ